MNALPIRIRLIYTDGTIYHWTVTKAPKGWQFKDHEGYPRFVEGNWGALVSRFRSTAQNYGMTCDIS